MDGGSSIFLSKFCVHNLCKCNTGSTCSFALGVCVMKFHSFISQMQVIVKIYLNMLVGTCLVELLTFLNMKLI